MLERIRDLPQGVDGLRAFGHVTREDYQETMRPLIEEARKQSRRIHFLYQLGPDLEGFSLGAAWEDARIGIHDLALFERCAIVSDIEWLRVSTRLFSVFLPCPVRVFANQDRAAAIEWLSASEVARSGLEHRMVEETGVLLIEPAGRLTVADFDAITATADAWIEAHDGLRGLVVHARHFPGWESFGSLVRHLQFVRNHQRRIGRVALSIEGPLAKWAPKLAENFVSAEIQGFAFDELDAAIAWASGSTPEQRPVGETRVQ